MDLTTIGEMAQKYGLPVVMLGALIYYFFFKYVPEQATMVKNIIDGHQKQVTDIIGSNKIQINDIMGNFRGEMESRSTQHKEMMADITKSNERIMDQTLGMMKTIQEHGTLMLNKMSSFNENIASTVTNTLVQKLDLMLNKKADQS